MTSQLQQSAVDLQVNCARVKTWGLGGFHARSMASFALHGGRSCLGLARTPSFLQPHRARDLPAGTVKLRGLFDTVRLTPRDDLNVSHIYLPKRDVVTSSSPRPRSLSVVPKCAQLRRTASSIFCAVDDLYPTLGEFRNRRILPRTTMQHDACCNLRARDFWYDAIRSTAIHTLGQRPDKTRPAMRRCYDSRRPTPDALASMRAHANEEASRGSLAARSRSALPKRQ